MDALQRVVLVLDGGGARTQTQLVRAIFTWVTQNVAYDVDAWRARQIPDQRRREDVETTETQREERDKEVGTQSFMDRSHTSAKHGPEVDSQIAAITGLNWAMNLDDECAETLDPHSPTPEESQEKDKSWRTFEGVGTESNDVQETVEVLRTKKALCGGYARLFEALCR